MDVYVWEGWWANVYMYMHELAQRARMHMIARRRVRVWGGSMGMGAGAFPFSYTCRSASRAPW